MAAQAFFNQVPLPLEHEPTTVDETVVPTATSTMADIATTTTSASVPDDVIPPPVPAVASVTGTLNHLGDVQIALSELPAEVRAFLESIPTVPARSDANRLVVSSYPSFASFSYCPNIVHRRFLLRSRVVSLKRPGQLHGTNFLGSLVGSNIEGRPRAWTGIVTVGGDMMPTS
jgi:hypothetical protein